MIKQKAYKRSGIRISTEFEICELEDFLKSIWGEESPLAHVYEIYSGHGKKENTGLYAVLKLEDKIVGCAGMKFVSKNQLELCSLAVSKEYRGTGLSTELFDWIDKTGREQVKLGCSLISYATLGSVVMHFITSKMTSLTNTDVYPLNVALGVIPISKDKAVENITSSKMLVHWKGRQYTSTLAILSMQKTALYEKVTGFEEYDFRSILPVKCVKSGQIEYVEQENSEVHISGTRLVIYYINSSETSKLPKLSSDRYHQILVPLTNTFAGVHIQARKKYVITGFNVINDILHIVYSNADRVAIIGVTNYLKTLENDVLSRFANSICELNRQ